MLIIHTSESMGKHDYADNDFANYLGCANKPGSNYPGYTVCKTLIKMLSNVYDAHDETPCTNGFIM